MIFEKTIEFEPTSLKRHRHTKSGRTYDPSSKEKENFLKLLDIPLNKMENPIKCTLHFFSERPKSHFRTGKFANELKKNAPKYNISKKDIDNMAKFVLDALNNKLYLDDAQIVELECKKQYSDKKGKIYMKFEEIIDEKESFVIVEKEKDKLIIYPILINLNSYKDNRGEFYESYKDILLKQHNIDFNIIQENTCISNKNVIRGFHYQEEPYSQAKLLQVLNGKILDIVINLETKEIFKYVLDSKEKQLLYIPKGYAHGYGILEDNTIVSYKTDALYNKNSENGFNPYSLNINWGIESPIISEKDKELKILNQ